MTSTSEFLNQLPDQIEPGESFPDIQAIQDQINVLYRQRVVLEVFEWVIKHKDMLPLCDFSLVMCDERVSIDDDVAFDADLEDHLKEDMNSEIEWLAEHLDEELDDNVKWTIDKIISRMNEAHWNPSLARDVLASCMTSLKNESSANWLARHQAHWEAEKLKAATPSTSRSPARCRI